ncbi:MAG: hypothetical protein ABSA57_00285 [Candidatus Acidiferrales bacterium]
MPLATPGAILDVMRLGTALLAMAVLVVLSLAHADELTLKDGTKIVGTIVAFEENSFKVKTSYGFAVVQKDRVASINMGGDAKSASAAKTNPAPAVEPPKPAEAAKPIAASASPAAQLAQPPSSSGTAVWEKRAPPAGLTQPPITAKRRKSETPTASKVVQAKKSPDQATAPAAAPTHDDRLDAVSPAITRPPAAANPVSPPVAALEPIREQVSGNAYTNETYGFQMYKPPTWEVIAGLPALLPGAIAAMGTNDQTTYLLVGQQPAGDSVDKVRDAVQRRLRDLMDNFRPLGETSITLSGTRATKISFRGGVDQHDWSGVAVFVVHGTRLFTIFGMTLADSDLVQIQENVIARAISSLQFTRQ